jgi:hypothetical protein
MSPETQNFDQLRRLLALKRHEQPPPGYFNHFSSQVIARIEAGERADDPVGFARWIWEGVWLQRLWDALEAKPALAGIVGAAFCGFLIAGVIYTDSPASYRSPLVETGLPAEGGMKMAGTQPTSAIDEVPTVLTQFHSDSGVPVQVNNALLSDMPKAGLIQPVFRIVGDN